jgi:hypothetical protein
MAQLTLQSDILGTASAGTLEYDGKVPYFTPQGAERGVIPGMQYYRLNSTVAGSNSTATQNVLGVGVTLSSSTIYQFEAIYFLIKTAGVTSHSVRTLFGGTATVNDIEYFVNEGDGNGTWGGRGSGPATSVQASNTISALTVTGALTAATQFVWLRVNGTVNVNVGGTFIPQYSLSAAPGGAYTTQIGSYFAIYPVGAAGSNINIGTWA